MCHLVVFSSIHSPIHYPIHPSIRPSTGVCLPNYERQAADDGQGESTLQLNGYVQYSCSEEGVLVHLYSDENCESLEDDFSYAIVYVPHSLCATVHHSRYH